MKITVKIYGDEAGFASRYAKRLKKVRDVEHEIDVETISPPDFRTQMEVLAERQALMRKKRRDSPHNSKVEIDKTGIFVVDYDLIKTYPGAKFLTAEDVCYLVRCCSDCGLLLGLNQYGHNPFDLTLSGHPESYADLNIGERQLDNAALWSGDAEFRPWSWPMLPEYLESFRSKIDDVRSNLDSPILKIIGMERAERFLSKAARSFLGLEPRTVTPRQFATKSNNGFRPKDRYPSPLEIARVTAARISKWLERMVLSGQEVLVDAPHLVSRFPSLLTEPRGKIESWNKTTQLTSPNKLPIDHKLIEDFRFKKDHWVSRPVWFWNELVGFEGINEIAEPLERSEVPFVFAEDASRFFKRSQCREFVAELDSPYLRRFVRYFRGLGIDYAPRTSLG